MQTRPTPFSLPTLRRLCVAACLSAGLIGGVHAQGVPQLPQIPAFLPQSTSVPATAPMAIDGEWTVSSLGKRIRIEGGRAYAVDSWLHMFVLQVQPGMVVIQNLQRDADGRYVGDDLPLMGKFTATVNAGGGLDVQVASVLGPISYQLIPVTLDDPARFEAARAGEADVPPDGEAADEDYDDEDEENEGQ